MSISSSSSGRQHPKMKTEPVKGDRLGIAANVPVCVCISGYVCIYTSVCEAIREVLAMYSISALYYCRAVGGETITDCGCFCCSVLRIFRQTFPTHTRLLWPPSHNALNRLIYMPKCLRGWPASLPQVKQPAAIVVSSTSQCPL